ncbi:hypothetical protein [Streptomyces sp. NPDC050263]|uniref:hypothetical protein n=1 Tax=Streptomyces sp. NPDC050263 TaxID=3155037 RepID=UPI00342DDC81
MNLSRTSRTSRTSHTVAAVAAATAIATLTGASTTASATASATSVSAPGQSVEARAYGSAPYAWATRRGSTIGIYGIDLHGQSFTNGGTVRMALFSDSGPRGIPVWTKDAVARRLSGRPGGSFDVRTGLLDCTAYGYAKDSTMTVWDIATDTWSNKVRVSTSCNDSVS